MKVKDLMTRQVVACAPETNLAAAAALMLEADCGVLPVIQDGKISGMITDRDIAIALGTRNRLASDVRVKEVAAKSLETFSPEEDISQALDQMRRSKVRRAPVIDETGKLRGILSLNDLILAVDGRRSDVPQDELIATMKAVSEHRPAPLARMANA